jgi:hypothetical protein
VVFAAESGRGKSTLAASFAVNGFRFLTDDGLVLEPAGEGYAVLPSHPGEGKSLGEVCEIMLEEYDVAREQLEQDFLKLAGELANNGYPSDIL